jgi:hypothetical protein
MKMYDSRVELQALETEDWKLDLLNESINNVESLLEKLTPHPVDKYLAIFTSLKAKGAALKKQIGSAEDVAKEKGYVSDDSKAGTIDADEVDLESEIQKNTNEILSIGRGARDAADAKYQLFTRLSLYFYALAFLVGVVGQLLGIHEETTEL